MKLKTLLLGSAAAFSVVSGAQAADLYVAEPVDYVKVCDAFGVGYWYIPGTDTCIKIGGYVRFDINLHDNSTVVEAAPTSWRSSTTYYHSTGSQAGTTDFHNIEIKIGPAHTGSWDFVSKGYVSVTAKSMTDYGPLTGFVAINGEWGDSSAPTTANATIDEAYLSLGPLLAGKTASTYDYGGGFTYDGADLDSDAAQSQVRLSWAMNGFGLMFGLEDTRFRWGSNATNDMPDLVAAITASQGPWDAKLSFGYADLRPPYGGGGWGVQGAATVKLDQIAPGDAFRVKVAYADDAYSFAGGGAAGPGTYWSALASFKHYFTPSVYGAVTYDYLNDPVGTQWQATGQITWMPVHNFQVGFEVGNTNTYGSDAWFGKIRLQRDWGE
jgi:hypothetical protein